MLAPVRVGLRLESFLLGVHCLLAQTPLGVSRATEQAILQKNRTCAVVALKFTVASYLNLCLKSWGKFLCPPETFETVCGRAKQCHCTEAREVAFSNRTNHQSPQEDRGQMLQA